MKYVRIIDENGFFIEDAFVEDITARTIEEPCPEGLYHPKWDDEKWVEGLTQEQIDTIKTSAVQEPSLEERLQALEMLELERLFGGM